MIAGTDGPGDVRLAGSVAVQRGDLRGRVGLALLALVVVVLAVWVPFNFSLGDLSDLVSLFVLIILGTTWNLLAGYGGMVSIGQQAFVGVGGYGMVYLADAVGLPLIPALLVGAVICALLALPTSFLVFRLIGGYFAIGTWVVAEVFELVTAQIDALGAGSGMSLTAFRGTERVDRVATVYWLGLAVTVLVVLVTYLLMRSRVGLGLTAIRDDVTAASNLGVDVDRGKRIVYVVAAAGAGLAGGLLAMNTLRVSPGSSYSVNFSAYMIFIVLIGGIGTIEGPILGAVVFFALQQEFSSYGTWYMVALGAIAVLIVLAAPRGLWGWASGRGRLQLFPVGYRLGGAADARVPTSGGRT